jgi:ubiquinone/menaquinone biosynthesis C-methylase UbiE
MARMVGLDGRIVCVDLQAEKLTLLRERAIKAKLSECIDTRIGSDSSLNIPDLSDQIDFALAYYVVHHAADVPGLMAEVYEALKSGGNFLIVEPGHHASDDECKTIEIQAQQAGFTIVKNPKLIRDWAILLMK